MTLFKFHNADIWLFLFLVALFVLFPEIDLAASDIFYNHDYWRWEYAEHPAVVFTYDLLIYLPYVLVPFLLVMSILSFKSRNKTLHGQRKIWLFLLLALLLGPGLFVHDIVKKSYDRPRPIHTIEFAGDYEFTPAFSSNAHCSKCRSFVSGHAAMGGFLLALVFVFRSPVLLKAALVFASIAGLGRMAQGGHFLSDVIFANYFCYFIYRLLSYFLLGHSRMFESKNGD